MENNEQTCVLVVEIDCAPGTPRPDTYMKSICKDILGMEYKNPVSAFFGEWDWKYEVPKNSFNEFQKKIMEYLTTLYPNYIRYGGVNKRRS